MECKWLRQSKISYDFFLMSVPCPDALNCHIEISNFSSILRNQQKNRIFLKNKWVRLIFLIGILISFQFEYKTDFKFIVILCI